MGNLCPAAALISVITFYKKKKKLWSHMRTGKHTVIIFLGGFDDEDPIADGD